MRRLPPRPVLGAGLLAGLVLAGIAFASVLGTIKGTNGTFDVTVTPAAADSLRSRISISYTPDTSKVNCSPIYLIQTCRDSSAGGGVIKPKDYKTTAFVHMQDDMTPGGTYVDHVVCEKDPFYNGEDEGKDAKSAGSSDGHTTTTTTMSDAPSISDGAFPQGVNTIISTFTVCAVCKPDGKILDCVTWTWTRTKGSAGKGTITGPTAASTATQEFKDAVAAYNSNHGNGTKCPELLAETNMGGQNVQPGQNKKLPLDPLVEGQPSIVQWNIVNTGGQDVTNVTWTVMLDGVFLTWGVVPAIGWFDFVTVDFPLPGLSAGPHLLTMLVDSDYLIPEYDEVDNFAMDEFVVRPATGVGPVGPAVRPGITALLPNPTRGRVAATVSLPTAAPASLELVDLSGRRVREFAVVGAGTHTLNLELGRDVGAGLYLLRLRQGGQEAVRKLTVVR
jgi:hypothetical protein